MDTTDILVIGARTLVGRRLRELVPDATFTSRQDLAGNSLYLDLARPESFRPERRFSQVIVTAPIWLVSDALLRHLLSLGMRRLVVFSSTSVFTKDVSDEPAEREVVQRLLGGEARVTAFCKASGVAGTILRPTLIYDEGLDDNVSRIRNLIEKLGFFPVCGAASGLRQPVHARDLARAALQVPPAEATHGKSYNLSGADSLSYRDMVARVFAATGRKPAVVSLPEWLWRVGFGVLQRIRPGQALKQNLAMAQRMNHDLWFDHASAARDFGYAPGPFKPDFTSET
ncbi:NAD dependent epimerase/dehydratase family protein [Asticcacaulis biprosthecium C19]|uniref:NAD dependent epimerase/dehydratase family protein n=1 Tax=Asticcacaulis biprosthecium C19 TaxID=715226 RepID=F4QS87_9CAUL|nr:NAD-dependent epimerase/dehydratase family protein [Asticcacaulis biprosthecium]EGF89607.1 NAD dependent epimerase/dehydratase family protein [Asticcacaulis biprosthecium C19]